MKQWRLCGVFAIAAHQRISQAFSTKAKTRTFRDLRGQEYSGIDCRPAYNLHPEIPIYFSLVSSHEQRGDEDRTVGLGIHKRVVLVFSLAPPQPPVGKSEE